jgi:hypothetical protein
MLGSRVIQRKERQLRIGIRQQIEIVTEIPAFTGGIPTDRTIWLREVTITVAVEVAILPAVTGMVGTETGCSDNRSTIAGKVKLAGIHLSPADGFIQETGPEDSEQKAVGFLIGTEGGL